MENERITVEAPVAWVLADHFTPTEVAKLNELVANRDCDGLLHYLWEVRHQKNYGIDPETLYNYLVEQLMTDGDEENYEDEEEE